MLMWILRRLFFYLVLWRNVATSTSLKTLRRTLTLPTFLMILRFHSFVSSRHGWLMDGILDFLSHFFLRGTPSGGVVCRLYLRQRNLSYISWEFCCQTILYMFFSNSLAPCILKVAHNSWKPRKASSFEPGSAI